MNYGYKPTTEGRELLAACLATGKGLEIVRVAVGSGKVEEGTDLADMTDLIQYVAEGSVAQRRHMDNVLYLTVQYASNTTPGLGAFYLGEFIVQAKHPISGKIVTLLYATLGDYQQPVNAYSESQAPDIRQYPIILVLSDEINVTISALAGLVTYEDLESAVEKACKDLVDTMASGGIKKTIDFTIPMDGWQQDEQATNGYMYYFDLLDTEITKNMIPEVTIAEASLETAKLCGVCHTAATFTGFVRLKSVALPEAEITATCCLLTKGTSDGSTGSGTIDQDMIGDGLTLTEDGKLALAVGDGLTIDEAGKLAVNVSTNEEASAAIDTVFDGEASDETP